MESCIQIQSKNMNQSDLKFCINCKHYINDIQENYQYCNNQRNVRTSYNLITGTPYRKIKHSLEDLRASHYACGKSGKWFDSKPDDKLE
jgi:tryptophanyl-tRNA synthetase